MAKTETQSRKPTHDILHVKGDKKKGEKTYYTRIGAAWMHDDGLGLNLSLEFIPTNSTGRLMIRLRSEKTDGNEEAAA